MSTGEILLEIMKYVGPAGLVLGAVALFLREQRSRKEAADRHKINAQTFAHMVPLRLQAYERLIIFMERISPDALVLRADGNGKTVRQLTQQMVAEIREEFAHNIAQQLYVKHETWVEVFTAKERVIALIYQASKVLPPDAPAIELSRRILAEASRSEAGMTQVAVLSLKEDVQSMFRLTPAKG